MNPPCFPANTFHQKLLTSIQFPSSPVPLVVGGGGRPPGCLLSLSGRAHHGLAAAHGPTLRAHQVDCRGRRQVGTGELNEDITNEYHWYTTR